MNRPTLALIVLLLASTCIATGCRKKSSRRTVVTNSSDIFTTDGFPGGPVQDQNVADDKRGMSPSGVDAQLPLVVFNGDRGTAIVTYVAVDSFGDAALYAHHFDGESWTPPVLLSAADLDTAFLSEYCLVAFLNTEDHPAEIARERNGDAVIVWSALDQPGAPGDGANVHLFATYFNASDRDDASTFHGFQQPAVRISSLEDDAGESVVTFGLASDGLCGEARWSQLESPYRWGDATSGLSAVWIQQSDNDPATMGIQGDRYWAYVSWDLAQSGDPEAPLTPGAMTRGPILGFGASDSGLASEETQLDDQFITYNNVAFFRVFSDADAGSLAGYTAPSPGFWGNALSAEDDITIQEVAFNPLTGVPSSPVTLHSAAPSSAVGDTSQSHADFYQQGGMFSSNHGFSVSLPGTFGSDEGLSRLMFLNLELTSDADMDFGEVAADGRLRLTEIDEATGAIQEALFLDADDPDVTDHPFNGRLVAMISRNGDYVWIVYQKLSDVAPSGMSADDHFGFWAVQYLTVREETAGSPAPLASRTSTGVRVNSVVPGGFTPNGIRFQKALGYICGIQSDPDVMNLVYEHSNATNDELLRVRLQADLDPSDNLAPGVATSSLGTFQNGEFSSLAFDFSGDLFVASADAGADGEIVVFFHEDVNTGMATERHVSAVRSGPLGTKVVIDSNAADRDSSIGNVLLVATPPGSEIGVFDPATGEDDDARAHAAEFVHVLFTESEVTDSLFFQAFRTRRYNAGDLGTALSESFSPPAGTAFEPPVQLDTPVLTTGFFFIQGTAVSGNDVGVWIWDDDRVYYQETGNDDGDDAPWNHLDPFLVDDDSSESILVMGKVQTRSCTCDTLQGAMIFWIKDFGGSSQNRLQCRIRGD